MKVWSPIGLGLVLMGCAWSQPTAREVFVSWSGCDDNPGTRDSPFLTIQRAVGVLKPGDTCTIRGGLYREMVRVEKSGRPGAPITFRACPGEEVFVCGTDRVSDWKSDRGRVYEARLNSGTRQVFLDGAMLTLARWPNVATLDPFVLNWAAVGSGSSAGLIVDRNLPSIDLAGVQLKVLPGHQWVAWTRPVLAHDLSRRRLEFDPKPFQRENFMVQAGTPYFLFGSPAFLDAPGEWSVGDGRLRLWAPAGDDPARHVVEARVREFGLDLSKQSFLRLEGLKFFACSVNLADCSDCALESCHFQYASEFQDCEGWMPTSQRLTGLVVGGDRNTIKDCSVVWSAGNGISLGGRNHRVSNCFIQNANYAALDCAGILAQGSGHVIEHCTIERVGRSGIVHYGMKGGAILRNDISNAGLLCSDLGGTYSGQNDGQGTEIAYNWVHDNLGKYACGVYLDSESANFIVHHNVCWRNFSGIRLGTPSHKNYVYHNTLWGNDNPIGFWGPGGNRDMTGSRVLNNILPGGVRLGEGVHLQGNFMGTDPELVDPEHQDFRLGPKSRCLGTGVRIPGQLSSGLPPDIGAYPAGAASWKPGNTWGRPPDFSGRLTQVQY